LTAQLLWGAYGLFGRAYEFLWKRGWIRPGGNAWNPQRGGEHEVRDDRPLWLHAASLGEVRVAQAYREALASVAPLYLTIQTDAGFRAAVAAFGARHVGYAPIDRPACVKRFLETVQPRGLVVFETEIWPGWLRALEGPVWFANARLSDRTCSRLVRVKSALTPIWSQVRMVFAQTSEDARRYRSLGVPAERVTVSGQVKQFDLPLGSGKEQRARWRRRLGLGERDLLYVAGSIRHDELACVLAQFRRCLGGDQALYLVLAPRHLKHVGLAERRAWELGFRTRRISGASGAADGAAVFVLDTHGDLTSLYAAADLALLGGTFAPHGGHNPNEPAAYGVPVVTGPFTQKIDADLALLADADLSYRLEDPALLPTLAGGLRKFNRARARHILEELIANRPHPALQLADSVALEWPSR
jgi:3-deoxy-D-manno-octulosonic-acid transferase